MRFGWWCDAVGGAAVLVKLWCCFMFMAASSWKVQTRRVPCQVRASSSSTCSQLSLTTSHFDLDTRDLPDLHGQYHAYCHCSITCLRLRPAHILTSQLFPLTHLSAQTSRPPTRLRRAHCQHPLAGNPHTISHTQWPPNAHMPP